MHKHSTTKLSLRMSYRERVSGHECHRRAKIEHRCERPATRLNQKTLLPRPASKMSSRQVDGSAHRLLEKEATTFVGALRVSHKCALSKAASTNLSFGFLQVFGAGSTCRGKAHYGGADVERRGKGAGDLLHTPEGASCTPCGQNRTQGPNEEGACAKYSRGWVATDHSVPATQSH